MQFSATKFGPAVHTFSCFLLVLTLFLSALSTAAPNPIPEAVAAPIASPPEIPVGIEPAVDVPFDDSEKNDTISDIQARAPPFCFRGWDQTNYRGASEQRCCNTARCCYFFNDLLNNRLYSAKAVYSDNGGVHLWTNADCTGTRRWVDFEGWWNLASAPAYYSMSQ